MKFWSTEHTFEHPWETVVTAAFRKYPNPMNPAVVGLDVVDRTVDKNGVLKSHRLMATKWGLPDWAKKLLGMEKLCFASEHSEVDPKNRKMKLRTRNLTFINTITIDECLTYEPHPSDPNKTQLKQRSEVTIHGIPLSSYMEKMVTDSMSGNAKKGRAAIEWVIDSLRQEAEELRYETLKGMDKLKHEAEDLKIGTLKNMDETLKTMDNVLHQTQNQHKQNL